MNGLKWEILTISSTTRERPRHMPHRELGDQAETARALLIIKAPFAGHGGWGGDMEKWMRTDEAEDMAASVRHVLRASSFVGEDPHAWKWVVLAIHSALQGACVCHLTTTAVPVGALTRRNTAEWLDFFESRRTDYSAKAPRTQLMSLPDLLKAIRKANSAGDHSDGSDVTVSAAEVVWLRRLHDNVRNQLVHFEPMRWSIEISGIPEFARVTSRILSEMLRIGWAFRHLSRNDREELETALQRLSAHSWPA